MATLSTLYLTGWAGELHVRQVLAKSRARAAQLAACPDEFHCAKCHELLNVREPARIRGHEVWCERCACATPSWQR